MDQSKQTLRVGDFFLDTQSGELRRNGETIRLPEQPFKILQLLVGGSGDVITRDELRAQLWPADTFVDFDRSLNSAMKKLRDALGDSADRPAYIETIPRRGYRLIAAVGDELAPQPRRRIVWISAAAAFAAVLLIAAFRFYGMAAPHIRSIAVLPLANLSGDPAQEYFADGMTEALITDVAQLKEVRVISRTSVMPYKQSKQSLPEIARQLNVDGVIEGGVVRSGSRVRITVQLIQASTDQHLWARSFERDFGDVVSLQRELSSAISEALHAELAAGAAQAARRIDADAYELFLRGEASVAKQTNEGVNDGIAHLEKAVAIQPDFAEAHAALAHAYSQQAYGGSVAPSDFMLRAKNAASKAVALDPRLARGHAELGAALFRFDWNWTASEQEMRRAIALNPNDAGVRRTYAMLLRAQRRISEADLQTQHAHELDPYTSTTADGALARGARFSIAGEFPKAIEEMRRATAMAPALPRAHFQLGSTLADAGQVDSGIAELERAVQMSPNNIRFRARLAWAYARGGQDGKARLILEELKKRAAHSYVAPTSIALVHIALHENQAALDLLEQAYRDRDFELIGLLHGPTFKPLQSEPRYQELVHKIGLPA